jgi:AcrR family transcriptional regulator
VAVVAGAYEPEADSIDALTTVERIRNAAMESFAAQGHAATTMRGVAAAAGVSLGLVQHHFETKAGLIKAVDDYVLGLLVTSMSQPLSEPAVVDSITELGGRITDLIAAQPDVAAYVGRTLVDGSPIGATIFDTLLALGTARWHQRVERGEARADVDITWAAINSLVLALGAISLRSHLSRHLAEPFTEPEQLERWVVAVNSLLREGLFASPE